MTRNTDLDYPKFLVPMWKPFLEAFIGVKPKRQSQINAILKCISRLAREVGTMRWGRGSYFEGLRCYLMTFIALGFIEATVLLS